MGVKQHQYVPLLREYRALWPNKPEYRLNIAWISAPWRKRLAVVKSTSISDAGWGEIVPEGAPREGKGVVIGINISESDI